MTKLIAVLVGSTRGAPARRCPFWLWLGLLAGVLTGCAGYQLGPTSGVEARYRSVQVNFFQNRALEPRLSEAVAQALRKRLQQEGTFKLATQRDGDIVVSGVILSYERAPVSYQPGDVATVQDYDITIRVHVTAEETATGKKLLDQEVQGRATVRIGAFQSTNNGEPWPVLGGDQANIERQNLPVLAADLAQNITARLVDGSW